MRINHQEQSISQNFFEFLFFFFFDIFFEFFWFFFWIFWIFWNNRTSIRNSIESESTATPTSWWNDSLLLVRVLWASSSNFSPKRNWTHLQWIRGIHADPWSAAGRTRGWVNLWQGFGIGVNGILEWLSADGSISSQFSCQHDFPLDSDNQSVFLPKNNRNWFSFEISDCFSLFWTYCSLFLPYFFQQGIYKESQQVWDFHATTTLNFSNNPPTEKPTFLWKTFDRTQHPLQQTAIFKSDLSFFFNLLRDSVSIRHVLFLFLFPLLKIAGGVGSCRKFFTRMLVFLLGDCWKSWG